ncbi:MAG: hypothetical protein IJ496_01100 [Ruminococcus sp.]|nr:hypothetical protein [Ruminococcus sp.]
MSVVLCFACISFDVQAAEWTSEKSYTYGELTYMITAENTISITGCAESAVTVEIPAEINGLPAAMG